MVAIITVHFNLSKDTIECVESLLKSDYADYKIYIVDNGSRLEEYENLKTAFQNHPNIELLAVGYNSGYVGGVNFGLQQADKDNPDYFMIMNNDTIIDKEAIKYLIEAAKRHDNRAIVTGKVYYHEQPDVFQHTGVVFKDHRYLTTHYPGEREKDVGQCDEEVERDSLDDVFWVIPRKIYEDVGLYCPHFFLYAEQGDYALRTRRKGYKLIYTPKPKIWHKESMSSGGPKALRVHYWRGKSFVVFAKRNMERKYFLIALTKQYFKTKMGLVSFSSYKRKRSLARIRGFNAGIAWLFHQKHDTGYNPYIK